MFKIKPTRTVRFYMKSGNIIEADRVYNDEMNYTYNDNQILSVTGWRQHKSARNRLMISSIDLKQIEAIMVVL